MAIKTVALLSPGDMGHAVGRTLVDGGLRVITCLEGRSQRSAGLAKKAGMENVSSYAQLVKEADMLLSILVPAQAKNAAQMIARDLKETGEKLVYVDCNAIAPETVREISGIIEETGSKFVDAGIIGAPPAKGRYTVFYASGKDAAEFAQLSANGLTVRVIGDEIGQASGIKMTYAAFTKGSIALTTELLVAARRLNLYEPLVELFKESQSDRFNNLERGMLTMPYRSRRWVGEMEEIARTFGDVGLTPRMLEGAADMYRFVGKSPLADETPENYDRDRTPEQMIDLLAGQKAD